MRAVAGDITSAVAISRFVMPRALERRHFHFSAAQRVPGGLLAATTSFQISVGDAICDGPVEGHRSSQLQRTLV
jgi:hypothetical protein